MWLLVHRGVLIWVELYLFVSQWSHFECFFRFQRVLRSHQVRPKDTLEPKKRNGVVYKIRECGKVYIGKMGRSMPERIKEHDRATLKQSTSSPDED